MKLLIPQIAFGPPASTRAAAKSSATEMTGGFLRRLCCSVCTQPWPRESCTPASCLLWAPNPDNHMHTLTINVALTRIASCFNFVCDGFYIRTKIHTKSVNAAMSAIRKGLEVKSNCPTMFCLLKLHRWHLARILILN